MPYQSKPFNNDYFVAREFLKIKSLFSVDRVIELGTCVGGSTKWFSENFNVVQTIEINDLFLEFAKKRCLESTNIDFYLGSTIDILPQVLYYGKYKATIIFIDSHWEKHFPLFEELDIIKKSGLQPIIVIHDCKVPNHPTLNFDSYNGIDICFSEINTRLDSIYGTDGYGYHYNSEIESTEIKRGVIYIYPKKSIK